MYIPFDIFKFLFLISILIWLVKISSILIFYFVNIKSWQKTEATIIESDVKYFRSKIDSDHEGWKEEIIYQYTVNSHTYQSNCVTKNLGVLLPFKDFSRKYNFKKDAKIEISYNPNNPQDAILDTKFNFFTLLFPLIFYSIIYIFIFQVNY